MNKNGKSTNQSSNTQVKVAAKPAKASAPKSVQNASSEPPKSSKKKAVAETVTRLVLISILIVFEAIFNLRNVQAHLRQLQRQKKKVEINCLFYK